jgi:predicted membrane-bound spermidine synthase
MPADAAITAAVFVSGAAGLIFQTVWFYRAALVLGGSVWAVTLVLASFMAGLALGNLLAGRFSPRVRRLLAGYAFLELVVAVTGVGATAILPRLISLGSPGAAIAALLALLVPATAMGATLPLVVGAAKRAAREFGGVLGRVYGVNTLGAVAGVAAAEFVLVGRAGVMGTALSAGVLNLVAAALAFSVASSGDGVHAHDATPFLVRSRRRVALLLACAALAGGTMLGLEVVWFRFLTLYVLSTTEAASLMLASVLAGIGAGGLIGGWSSRRGAAGQTPVLFLLAGIAVLVTYLAFDPLTSGTQVGDWRRLLWFAACLTLPNALLSGVLFAVLGEALHREIPREAQSTAWLTLANTLGALAGASAGALVLLPRLGLEGSMLLFAALYGVAGMLGTVALRPLPRSTRMALPALAVALLAALVAFPSGWTAERYFARAAAPFASDGSRIVATRQGALETIFLMEQDWMGKPIYQRLVTNGFSMTGTALPGLRYMRYFAYWPMFVHNGPLRKALLICYGAGVTASAVLQIPSLESMDVVELSPDMVAMSDVIYANDRHPLRDSRTELHVEDGRYFLETTDERFDLITGEPPPPRTPGAANIYTREYFALMYDRLADGGIATYWLPVARPQPGTDVDTIIRAFCEVFANCSLWNATPSDFMLAGSRGATANISEQQLAPFWQLPALQASLREVGFERPEQVGATFLGDAAYLRTLTAETPPLVDNFPHRLKPGDRPSLSDPRLGSDEAVTAYYREVLNPARAARTFESSPYIRRAWSDGLRRTTLPFFVEQRMINNALAGAAPLAMIEDLHTVLTTTTLRTLPLWLLGSDDVRQRIAESVAEDSAVAMTARGLRALSGRDYNGAAMWFLRAQQNGGGPSATAYFAYALCLAGRLDEAKHVARRVVPHTEDEKHFWSWIERTFGVGANS